MARPTKRWNDDERFAFATQRLRAQTMPNRRALNNKRACRGRLED
jgi:hypothetical protein